LRLTSLGVAIAISVLATLLTIPAEAAAGRPDAPASAGWHGRAIQNPLPAPRSLPAGWPRGWSAGPVRRGTGFVRPGGSRRVRAVQQRLIQLGYRPGPIDGLFGPRTEAAARWFQYKHGLPADGRVDRRTLVVLVARSNHQPLRREAAQPTKSGPPAPRTQPAPPPAQPAPAPVSKAGDGVPLVLVASFIAAALMAGVLVGVRLPRRRPHTPVIGYIAGGGLQAADAEAPALERACDHRRWTLVRIVQEHDDAGPRLRHRPALQHALEQIKAGAAAGLVITNLREFATRSADLAALMQALSAANGFLAAVDDDLDTSTPDGRATLDAVIDIAGWRQQLFGAQRRSDLEPRVAALRDRDLPDAAIADALNLAGVPAPSGSDAWRPGDVAAASRRAQEAHS
jgi:peptidoglycan hydrolase-like protein with peptidoglycan-binding domain